jgi:hypothetical protein
VDIGLVLTIVGTLLAIVAFPATYYMGRRNRQRPDLCYVRDFDVLMSPDDGLAGGNLGLTIGGHEIERISRTYIALFNRKGDSVSGEDVVASDKLRVTVEHGDRILQARVIAVSRPQCGVSLNLAPSAANIVEVNFDFLDAKDGAILEILHQGASSATIAGTIRGASFHDRGKAELTPNAIRTIAAKSLIARYNHFSKKKGLNRFSFSVMLLLPLMMLGMAALVFWTFAMNQPSGPISVEGFDFTTLEGQKEFIAAANASGIRPKLADYFVPTLIIMFGLLFCGVTYMYGILITNRIPTAITSHIVEVEPSH